MCVFIISCFFLTFGYVYAEGFSLKPYVQIENSMVTFGSLIDKKLDPEVAGIIIYQGKENEEIMLKADVILTKLEQAGVFNLSLSGKHSIVQIGQPHMQKEQKEMNEPENALDYLKKHLYSFVDKDKYRIELNILNINPQFDLEQPFEQVEWLLPPIKNGLSDLRKFENIRIKSKNKTSQVRLKISLYANVFIIKEIHEKDEIIRGTHFKQQEMDLMTVGGFENIVVTLGDYQYAKAVNPGDILRYVNLKKLVLVHKGDNVRAIMGKGAISVETEAVALHDGYANERLRIKTRHGGTMHGMLRSLENESFVEVY